jgi:hypothetical protein
LDVPSKGGHPFFCLFIKDMKTLDLHGVYHYEVERLVVNFIFLNELPLKIITGDSTRMKQLVFSLLEEYEFLYVPESNINFGAYIVRDKRK